MSVRSFIGVKSVSSKSCMEAATRDHRRLVSVKCWKYVGKSKLQGIAQIPYLSFRDVIDLEDGVSSRIVGGDATTAKQ